MSLSEPRSIGAFDLSRHRDELTAGQELLAFPDQEIEEQQSRMRMRRIAREPLGGHASDRRRKHEPVERRALCASPAPPGSRRP
jgi:hypothetical protein